MKLERKGLKPVRNRTWERYGLQLWEACDQVTKDLDPITEKYVDIHVVSQRFR
jgi:hypothetical protein